MRFATIPSRHVVFEPHLVLFSHSAALEPLACMHICGWPMLNRATVERRKNVARPRTCLPEQVTLACLIVTLDQIARV